MCGFFRSDLAFYGIYGASGLAVGIVAVWLEKIFVIVATSFTGSLMFLLGRYIMKNVVINFISYILLSLEHMAALHRSFIARMKVTLFFAGLDCYCRTAFSTLIKQVLFQTKEVFSKAAFAPSQVKLGFNERHDEFTDQGEMLGNVLEFTKVEVSLYYSSYYYYCLWTIFINGGQ